MGLIIAGVISAAGALSGPSAIVGGFIGAAISLISYVIQTPLPADNRFPAWFTMDGDR